MTNYDLEAIYCNQKSFYGKAKVREIHGVKILRSYETDVAAIDIHGEIRRIGWMETVEKNYGLWGAVEEWVDWTPTTGRHIREFARQNGIPDFGKKAYFELIPEDITAIIAEAVAATRTAEEIRTA